MNKIELISKVLRQHWYAKSIFKLEVLTVYDLQILLDLIETEIDTRDIK